MLAFDAGQVDASPAAFAGLRPCTEPMKILHVETGRHFYGGPQQVAYLLRGLSGRAVDNVLVCVPGSDIDAAARAAGVHVYNVPCGGDFDVMFAWWLGRILRWETPDLVHCHSRRGADLLGGMAAKLAGVPAILSRRVDHPTPGIFAAARERLYRNVVAISDNVAASLREDGMDEGRVTVIRSAVDFQRFQQPPDGAKLRAEFALREDDLVMAAVGQLIPRKGHRYLLEAMSGLRDRFRKLVLLVFGQGALEDELKEQTGQLGLEEIVRFLGFRDDLDDYLGAVDLLVHPALREGLGVSMLKAAAAGVPVIAFDVAGAREAVVDGVTGVLVTPKDPRALERAVSELLSDAVLRKRLGEAGRQRMRTDFSIETMVDQHIRLYETVLNDAR